MKKRIFYKKHLTWILILLMLSTGYVLSCSSGGDDDETVNDTDDDTTTTIPGDSIEGDTGIFYIDGTECFESDAQPLTGSSVYVSPNGSDTNDGLTSATPLQTLAKALCNAQAGQTVYLLPGTYNESVILGNFGDAASPITISGVLQDGIRPVIDGGQTKTFGIAISDSKNFVIENIQFQNFTDAGLYVQLTEGLTIDNNIFNNNGFHSINPDADGEGFGVAVVDIKNLDMKNNEAYANGPEDAVLAQDILGTGIDMYNVDTGTVTNNHSHDNIGGGMLVEDCKHVTVSGNELNNNMLWGGYWDGAIWIDGCYDISVTNNNIHDNLGPGLEVSDESLQFPYGSCRYTVTDNTITDNYWAIYTFNMTQCPLPDSVYLVFENNTISGNSYPGTDEDSINITYGEYMCEEWACGDNQPCDDPEDLPTEDVCTQSE